MTRAWTPGLRCMSIACLALALAPAAIAPAKQDYDVGQPEMQQSMDNMKEEMEEMVRKAGSAEGYKALLTQKTSTILNEAQNMLNRVKNVKERRWLQSFVLKMKNLAEAIEHNVDESKSTHEPIEYPIKESAQESSKDSSMASKPVPASEQPAPAVPKTSMKSVAKQREVVNRHPLANRIGAEAPQQVQDMEEDDELVKELEDLRKTPKPTFFAVVTTPIQNQVASTNPPPEAGPGVNAKRISAIRANRLAIINEKNRLRVNLAQEVSELERLGATEEEILHTLHLNGYRRPGMINQNLMFRPMGRGDNMYRNNLYPVNGPRYINDAVIPYIKPNIWQPKNFMPTPKEVKQAYFNNTYQNGPEHFLPKQQQARADKYQNEVYAHDLYPQRVQTATIKNMIQRLNRQRQNFLYMNHVPGVMKDQGKFMVASEPSKHVSQSGNRFLPKPDVNLDRPNSGTILPTPTPTPIPKPPTVQRRNSTIQGQQPEDLKTSFTSESFPSHHIENEFSEEMKRQLRDGKVIILSDSVVRTNFDDDGENGHNHQPKEKKKTEKIEERP